jgi:DNA-directed RNA polymerase specialized sigma24 family protein
VRKFSKRDMSTTSIESPSNLNRLHMLWIAEPTKHEAEFFTELRLSVTKAVAKITKQEADQDIVSDALLHLLSIPRGKTHPRLDQFEPRGSFFGWVWEVTDRFLKDVWKKKTAKLTQVKDDHEMEAHRAKFAEDNPPVPKVSVDWIQNAITRKIAEGVLDGAKIEAASEAVGLTGNAGRMRLRKLGKTNAPEVMTEAYERGLEAAATLESWRQTLRITIFIDKGDPVLDAGWTQKAA